MPSTTTDTLVEALAGKLTHTVGFERTVQVRPYESAKASIFIQFSTDRDASAEEIVGGANEAFLQAKGIVFAQLNLDHDLDETGILLELVDNAFGPGVERVNEGAKTTKALPSTQKVLEATATVPDVAGKDVSGVPAQPPFAGTTRDKDEKKANREWAEKRFDAFPGEFFDNRADKADGKIHERSPDYKHKGSGVGLWVN